MLLHSLVKRSNRASPQSCQLLLPCPLSPLVHHFLHNTSSTVAPSWQIHCDVNPMPLPNLTFHIPSILCWTTSFCLLLFHIYPSFWENPLFVTVIPNPFSPDTNFPPPCLPGLTLMPDLHIRGLLLRRAFESMRHHSSLKGKQRSASGNIPINP